MARKKQMASIPEVTIEKVLAAFLDDQRARLKPRTFQDYEAAIGLFTDYLDGYGPNLLDDAENRLWDKHHDAKGEDHREFVELFGPEKIPDHVDEFLGYYMVRKVAAGASFKQASARVVKKLIKWLVKQEHVEAEDAVDSYATTSRASRDLPRAERASFLLSEIEVSLPSRPSGDGFVDFGHCDITRLEPGKLWLASMMEGGEFGPIDVPETATDLLEKGWTISCALVRRRGRWHLAEVANVYP